MYNLNINSNNDSLVVLNKYMFNNVNNTPELTVNKPVNKPVNNVNKPVNNIDTKFSKKLNPAVPRSSINVNYNKHKSKHMEFIAHSTKKNLTDTFFWCFYKLHLEVSDKDLEYINTFTTEKEFKFSVIEKIQSSKELLKKHKIQRNAVTAEITNDKKISLNTFKALCILYNINIVVIKDNNTYSCFTDNNLENNSDTIDNLDTYHAIKLMYKNTSSINKNFEIIMNVDKLELQDAVNNYYYVKDLNKPLKSISSYKSVEMIEIAQKLNIILTDEHGKKKTKIALYAESVKKLT
jgi:hypothetical protein